MQHLLRAIIVGFGTKLGAELARVFVEKMGITKAKPKAAEEELAIDLPSDPSGPAPGPSDEDPATRNEDEAADWTGWDRCLEGTPLDERS